MESLPTQPDAPATPASADAPATPAPPTASGALQWIVFGDDWGSHPSTTQHLILNLPPTDRVVWVESIGMRSPKLNLVDLRRVLQKAVHMVQRKGARAGAGLYEGDSAPVEVVSPRVLPWHRDPRVRRLNGWSLARSIDPRRSPGPTRGTVLLTSVPVVVDYVPHLAPDVVAYLRLDDYAYYPGVDSQLVLASEASMYARADLVFATARRLLPPPRFEAKGVYLPQGVNWTHFAQAPLEPAGKPVLGFFGTLSSWVDTELIVAVAKALPEWELRLIGKREVETPEFDAVANVSVHDPVPFSRLPGVIGDWAAAWIPFRSNRLTDAVNPLKVWEYLAAGLNTMSTPIPEVAAMVPRVSVSTDADEIAAWARDTLETDTVERRRLRRESVRGDDWVSRAATLRRRTVEVLDSGGRGPEP